MTDVLPEPLGPAMTINFGFNRSWLNFFRLLSARRRWLVDIVQKFFIRYNRPLFGFHCHFMTFRQLFSVVVIADQPWLS